MLETDRIYLLENELADLNENNYLKPYGYQKLFIQLGDMHLNNIDLNINAIAKDGLAWAFTSMSIEIVRPIKGMSKIKGKTWHAGRKGPLFRREYLFTDEDGEVLFKGASFSVLLDTEKRSIYRKKELPFEISAPIEEYTIHASTNKKPDLDFIKIDERVAYNCYIDALGHVNNSRYGEFAYDTFTGDEIQNLNKLKRIDIYFRSELRRNDSFSIYKVYDGEDIYVRGENNNKDDISFDIIYTF